MFTGKMKDKRKSYRLVHLVLSCCLVILLALVVVACSSGASNPITLSVTPTLAPITPSSTPAGTKTPQKKQTAAPATPTPAPLPSGLQGPVDFRLDIPLHFSDVSGSTTDVNGTTTQLSTKSIESGVNGEFQNLLFAVDSSDNINVFNPGATSPTAAEVARNSNGTTNISYTQTTNSDAGSFAITFESQLFKNQIEGLYEQQFSPLLVSGTDSSQVEVGFSAKVTWIPQEDIPAVPQGGSYTLTSSGGVMLSWIGSPNASSYDVYRLIASKDQQFQLLARVKTTSYEDNSSLAKKNIHARPGIAYAVFSVGPTGIENPSDIIVSISS